MSKIFMMKELLKINFDFKNNRYFLKFYHINSLIYLYKYLFSHILANKIHNCCDSLI